ncbi:APHP domain protein [Geobacter metallireducens RCH3]|uniref:CARDB domain lipoprotein, putative n=1 Tax=Geobacter metallireducens (strain ATCC 53774 / DSM 7210 / GS-15) TaxID=269799 RepID=Q39U47_GEOMG|nr:CARDB domain-containing protein [Geobacter metallireducens]ABB32227.1 CARDB domain lipoprotein, putative [Geobacter metallireducens GS-15]EHP87005.1 APHP domain protein [Geobacter metallireducens RCH3]
MCRSIRLTAMAAFLVIMGGAACSGKPVLPDLTLEGGDRSYSELITAQQHSFSIHTPSDAPLENSSIRIEVNEGESLTPRLRSSGSVDCSSLASVVAGVVAPGMTAEEKALALWRFVMDSCYHGRWGTSLDGLEHLNVYGYGYCGTYAAVLESLWWTAGLTARHVNIGNHAATEVYYNNDWHYIDADTRTYFLLKDNRTIASLDELNDNVELWTMLRRGSSRKAGKKYYYMTMHPNGHGRSPVYTNDFTMAKGDVLTLDWQSRGKWCLNRGQEGGKEPAGEPPFYGNGLFTFHRDFKDRSQSRSGLVSSTNIDWQDAAAGYLHPQHAKQEASLVYRVKTPYFIPETTLSGSFFRKGTGDSAAIDISTDNGKRWVSLWRADATGTVKASVVTAQTQQVTTDVPWKYSYLMRLRMRAGKSPRDVGAYHLDSASVLAYNPRCLPALRPGDNRITFSDGSQARRTVRVTYNWHDDLPITLSKETPFEGEEITVSARVTNRGAAEAHNVPVAVYLGNPAQGGVEIGRDTISRIPVGGTGLARVQWKATRKLAGRAANPGVPVYAVVDPDNRVAESDKANNVFSRIVKVLNPPDVRIPSESFIRFERAKDHSQSLAVVASVRNFSNSADYGLFLDDHGTGEAVEVTVYDGNPAKGGKVIGRETISRLLPLEHRNVSVKWDIAQLKGVHTVYVQVHPPANLTRAPGKRAPAAMAVPVDLDAYRSCKGI